MSRGAALGAATTIALLWGVSAALAISGAPGGTAAPSSTTAATSQAPALAPLAAHGPVVGELSVPATAIVGPAPRVSLQLDEQGVGTVYVRVTLSDLTTHATALVAWVGWVRTGRTFTVRWPAGARLPAGSYRVIVNAHDHHNANLLRNAHSSGEAILEVVAPAAPTTATPAAPILAAEPGVPSPAETVAEGAVFPVAGVHDFGGPENVFGAPRDGYLHQGQDILTAEGTPILAPVGGTILTTSYQAGAAGYYAVLHTPIGFDFMFAHCETASLEVTAGELLSAGEQLCSAGQTGDATAPHLDFEMWVGGWQASTGHPINPLPYLEAWEHG